MHIFVVYMALQNHVIRVQKGNDVVTTFTDTCTMDLSILHHTFFSGPGKSCLCDRFMFPDKPPSFGHTSIISQQVGYYTSEQSGNDVLKMSQENLKIDPLSWKEDEVDLIS